MGFSPPRSKKSLSLFNLSWGSRRCAHLSLLTTNKNRKFSVHCRFLVSSFDLFANRHWACYIHDRFRDAVAVTGPRRGAKTQTPTVTLLLLCSSIALAQQVDTKPTAFSSCTSHRPFVARSLPPGAGPPPSPASPPSIDPCFSGSIHTRPHARES